MKEKQCGWRRDEVSSGDAKRWLKTLCQVIFYLEPFKKRFNERGFGLPDEMPAIDNSKVYNNPRSHGHTTPAQLDMKRLSGYVKNLSALCTCGGFLEKRKAWKWFADPIKAMLQSMTSMVSDMKKTNMKVQAAHSSLTQARSNSDSINLSWITIVSTPESYPQAYRRECEALEAALDSAGPYNAVALSSVLDFNSRHTRTNFVTRVKLMNPTITLTRAFGNFLGSFVWFIRIPNPKPDDHLTRLVRLNAKCVENLPLYHTRAMRTAWKSRFSYMQAIGASKATMADVLYSMATGDNSAAYTGVGKARRMRMLKLALELDDPDAIGDLRHFNGASPNNAFDPFFNYLSIVAHDFQTAHERRHSTVGVLPLMTLKSLKERVLEECKRSEDGIRVEDLVIPSDTTITYNFCPSDSYRLRAARYKGTVELVRTVQERTERAEHPDAHYGRALQRYLREVMIRIRDTVVSMGLPEDTIIFVSQDDKCLIIVGEPGLALSALQRQRGRCLGVPGGQAVKAGDHDTNKKVKIVPTVVMKCKIPGCVSESAYRGNVFYTLADAAFSPTTCFSNMVAILEMVEKQGIRDIAMILCVLSDGGADHNVVHSSVQIAVIALCIYMKIDIAFFMRTIPGHSWTNIVERVMAIFNIGLYHVALERPRMDDRCEEIMSKCGGLVDVREEGKKSSHFKGQVQETMGKVSDALAERFNRLSLKDEPFQRLPSYDEATVERFFEVLRRIDPAIDFTKPLTRANVSKLDKLNEYLQKHLHVEHYWLMYSKCKQEGCYCGEVRLPMEVFDDIVAKKIPEPQPDPNREGHYRSFNDSYGNPVDPSVYVPRPSVATTERVVPQRERSDTARNREEAEGSAGPKRGRAAGRNKDFRMAYNNVVRAIKCVECDKPRYAI